MYDAILTSCRTCVGRVVEGQVDMSDVRVGVGHCMWYHLA